MNHRTQHLQDLVDAVSLETSIPGAPDSLTLYTCSTLSNQSPPLHPCHPPLLCHPVRIAMLESLLSSGFIGFIQSLLRASFVFRRRLLRGALSPGLGWGGAGPGAAAERLQEEELRAQSAQSQRY